MYKKTFSLILVLFTLLLPGVANAVGNLTQADGNIWTLYVFGNGDAILNILNAVKLLMVPNIGDSGLNGLMTFLAVLGFLVLAVQAGFDPAKNLTKMFSFIVVVAAVHILTTQVKADIYVYDRVQSKASAPPELMVAQDVPALVGVPAAIISDVGEWLTRSIETHFVLAEELTLSGGKRAESGGTFNLFGKIMQETDQVSISDADLKKSLSAYMADCVVPVMAQGGIKVSELMQSPVLTKVLEKAAHKSIMTKYWPMGNYGTTPPTYAQTIAYDGDTYSVQGELGTVIPCAGAWSMLVDDLDKHSTELMDGTAAVWAKTGVLVPFEQGMSAAMQLANNGGANAFSNYSRPNGFILQQAFINGMSGTFRSAAASIGNNDLMMSASIAQAEQSQRTSWFTAARVFGNMMGYVYTVLQAFIFAIVPVVIIALMVPGLGKVIFVNYAQILVWLMLWQPMLSIVNFLITLFGKASIGTVLDMGGGITMQNKAAYSQATNDLLLAAQFLGTSVPLLTWGLVKGSMAFTEFISHGIGSSMAQQAGASAATGNMSMNNMSMDNASMNKYNTAMSSTVGAQTTMGYSGTGSGLLDNDAGGHKNSRDGSAMTTTLSTGLSDAKKTSITAAANAAQSTSDAISAAENSGFGKNAGKTSSDQYAAMSNVSAAWAATAKKSEDAGQTEAAREAKGRQIQSDLAIARAAQTQLKLGISPPGGAGLAMKAMGIDAGIDLSSSQNVKNGHTLAAVNNLEKSLVRQLSTVWGTGESTTDGSGTGQSHGRTNDGKASMGGSHDFNASVSHQLAASRQAAKSISLDMSAIVSNDRRDAVTVPLERGDQDRVERSAGNLVNTVPAAQALTEGQVTAATTGVGSPADFVAGRAATAKAQTPILAKAAMGAGMADAGVVTSGAPTVALMPNQADPAAAQVRLNAKAAAEKAATLGGVNTAGAVADAANARTNDGRGMGTILAVTGEELRNDGATIATPASTPAATPAPTGADLIPR